MNEKKKRWIPFQPLHSEKKQKLQQTAVIHWHDKRLQSTIWKQHRAYPGEHSSWDSGIASPAPMQHFEFHSVHIKAPVKSIVCENTGLHFMQPYHQSPHLMDSEIKKEMTKRWKVKP